MPGKKIKREASTLKRDPYQMAVILTALTFSGAAALIYEIVWTRHLEIIFGSTTYAFSTMLSAFLSGLALGAFIAGRWVDKGKELALTFASLEFGIGIFGLLMNPLLNQVFPFYIFIYRQFHLSFPLFTLAQFVVSFLIMSIPTLLMGATFPVALKLYARDLKVLGDDVGKVYSFNTLGSVAGAFLTGFILIPWLGVRDSAVFAVCLNFLAGTAILIVFKWRQTSIS